MTQISPNDPAIRYSPGNWAVTSASAFSISAGAYLSVLFSGTSATLNFDTTHLLAPYSQLYYSVDGQPRVQATLSSATVAVTIPAATADNPYHMLEVWVKSTSETLNRWNSPSNTAVILTSIALDQGAVVVAPGTSPRGSMVLRGDSITEDVRGLNDTAPNDTDRNDALTGWAYQLRRLLGLEVGLDGYGGSGICVTGSGNYPPLSSAYNQIAAGIQRAVPVDLRMVVVNLGTNDQHIDANTFTLAMTTALNNLLAFYPGVPIAVLRTFGGYQVNTTVNAIAACAAPSRVYFVDTTGFLNPAYGIDSTGLHPRSANDIAVIAPLVAAALEIILAPPAVTGTQSFF